MFLPHFAAFTHIFLFNPYPLLVTYAPHVVT